MTTSRSRRTSTKGARDYEGGSLGDAREPLARVELGEAAVDLDAFSAISGGARVFISPSALERARRAAAIFEASIDAGTNVYGVTTGYGSSSATPILPADRPRFQLATLRGSAWGTGALLSWQEARGAWLSKALGILTGHTGARAELVEVIVALLNAGFAPSVPSVGSLGASGDLIPSAHFSLPLVGEGSVLTAEGVSISGAAALEMAGVRPASLGPRDGLSLVNGTAVTTSLSCHACIAAERLLSLASLVVAAGIEAKGGHVEAFAPEVVDARPYHGAIVVAGMVREGLAGAQSGQLGREGVHDSYAWRCVPQVHGTAHSTLTWAKGTCEVELAACTDNPVVDRNGLVYSGGNFHAAPLGVAMDALALAVGEVAGLSRQRLAHLVAFASNPIERVSLDMLLTSATALLLEFTSAGPATGRWLPIDSAEDHVSNATLAARRAQFGIESTFDILAAECLAIAATFERAAAEPQSAAGHWLVGIVRQAGAGPIEAIETGASVLVELGQVLAGKLASTHG
jgi:histidine ammonia-lyase